MSSAKQFSLEEAKQIGDALGIDWSEVNAEQFRQGLAVEMEHGTDDERTNVTHGDPLMTGKIVWAHLNEYQDYYTRLAKLEAEAETYWSARRSRGG